MFSKENKLSLHATSNGNVRVLVDGKVHPLMAGYPTISDALSVVFKQDLLQRVYISDTAYFHWPRGHQRYELVEEGVHSRPEEAGETGFTDMVNLIEAIVKAENNGSAIVAVASYRKKLRTELMPEFDNKDLTYGHKRIPRPLVPFFMKEFELLGKLDDSFEEKPYGDERLLTQAERLQKSLAKLPDSNNKTKLQQLAGQLVLAISDLQANGLTDWSQTPKLEYGPGHPDCPFGDYQLLHDLRDIQARVECLPAGFHQTTLSSKLGEASHGLQNLLMHGTHYWPNLGSDYPPPPAPAANDEQASPPKEKLHVDFNDATKMQIAAVQLQRALTGDSVNIEVHDDGKVSFSTDPSVTSFQVPQSLLKRLPGESWE